MGFGSLFPALTKLSLNQILTFIVFVGLGSSIFFLVFVSPLVGPDRVGSAMDNAGDINKIADRISNVVTSNPGTNFSIPRCGNKVCEPGESANTCLVDCFACNENGSCEPDIGENSVSCKKDCPASTGRCVTDGFCNVLIGETVSSCPSDCAGVCNNNGNCDLRETPFNCPNDCTFESGDGSDDGQDPLPPDSSTQVCGDGSCNATETCSSCPTDCGVCPVTLVQTCGNNLREGTETCDGSDLNNQTCISKGFSSGVLFCLSNCTDFNFSACGSTLTQTCGNGLREGSEVCDKTDLNGQTCQTKGYTGGTLTCQANCQDLNSLGCIGNNKLIGNNLAWFNDYDGQIPYTNVFKLTRPWITRKWNTQTRLIDWTIWDTGLEAELPSDEAGYPLELPYQVPGEAYPTVVETLLFDSIKGKYPAGTYTVFYDGDGDLKFIGDTEVISSTPGKILLNVTPTNGGIHLQITRSNPANHVRNIRMILPGFENNYSQNVFYPTFLQRLNGFSVIRYVDAMLTVNTNMARWEDRTKPGYYTQNKLIIRTGPISSIKKVLDKSFFASNYTAQVKTLSPHHLITGQLVTISGSDASTTLKDASGETIAKSFNLSNLMVQVIDDYTFNFDYNNLVRPPLYSETSFNEASNGDFTIKMSTGAAMEDLISISNLLNADMWVNIPAMADDNYVKNLANMIHEQLNPDRKIYIEYSTELWNTVFYQTAYVDRMGCSLHLDNNCTDGVSDAGDIWASGLVYQAKRSAEIFKIFEDEFGGDSRLVKGLASQAGNSYVATFILKSFYNPTINPYNISADALSIAPYFGAAVADQIGKNNEISTITVPEILDRAEASITGEVTSWIIANKQVADRYNLALIADQGGQSLVPANFTYLNNQTLTDKLIAANEDARMYTQYQEYFSVWFANGGGLMVMFENVYFPTKYGSWGLLEYQDQPISDAPKYRATMDYIHNK